MIGRSGKMPVVEFSVNLYRILLFAYPAKFQREYGCEMAQVFRDACLRATRQNGLNGMLKLWSVTLLDLAQSVITEHTHKETQMKKEMKPEDVRRAGWALIWGGISFTLSIFLAITEASDWSPLALLLQIFISLPLLVFGILGLRIRYGEQTGSFGKNILLVGAILGPATSLIGFFLMNMDPFWFIIYSGPAVLFICLTLFGLAVLNTQPMPRWNILPVIAGLSYPAVLLFYILTSIATGGWSGSELPADAVIIILITIQGIALLALGYILKSDVPEESPAIA